MNFVMGNRKELKMDILTEWQGLLKHIMEIITAYIMIIVAKSIVRANFR